MLFAVVEQQNSLFESEKMRGEYLEQTYKSLQIFAKLLNLLAESTAQFSVELEGVQARAQGRRMRLQQLQEHVQFFKATPLFNYPG